MYKDGKIEFNTVLSNKLNELHQKVRKEKNIHTLKNLPPNQFKNRLLGIIREDDGTSYVDLYYKIFPDGLNRWDRENKWKEEFKDEFCPKILSEHKSLLDEINEDIEIDGCNWWDWDFKDFRRYGWGKDIEPVMDTIFDTIFKKLTCDFRVSETPTKIQSKNPKDGCWDSDTDLLWRVRDELIYRDRNRELIHKGNKKYYEDDEYSGIRGGHLQLDDDISRLDRNQLEWLLQNIENNRKWNRKSLDT